MDGALAMMGFRLAPPVHQGDERKPLWRTLSYHASDPFADWVCDVASRRLDPDDFLRACVAVVEVGEHFGKDARRAVAELCLPDVWDEERYITTTYFACGGR